MTRHRANHRVGKANPIYMETFARGTQIHWHAKNRLHASHDATALTQEWKRSVCPRPIPVRPALIQGRESEPPPGLGRQTQAGIKDSSSKETRAMAGRLRHVLRRRQNRFSKSREWPTGVGKRAPTPNRRRQRRRVCRRWGREPASLEAVSHRFLVS